MLWCSGGVGLAGRLPIAYCDWMLLLQKCQSLSYSASVPSAIKRQRLFISSLSFPRGSFQQLNQCR